MSDLGIFRRGITKSWWVILLVTVAAAASAVVFTAREQPVYQAYASLVVTPNSEVGDTTDLLRSLETLERRTILATFAKIPSRRETRYEAATRLGWDPAELVAYRIRGWVIPNTNIVRIDVEGHDPARVKALVEAASAITREEARRLYRIYKMEPLTGPETPRRPIRPDPRRNVAVATVVGLFLGLLSAFLLEGVRSRSAIFF